MTEFPGERLLSDSHHPTALDDDRERYFTFDDAWQRGAVLRTSYDRGLSPSEIEVREYSDPEDHTTRYVVIFEDNSVKTVRDYPDRDTAESRYEREVRALEEVDYLFAVTDVDGVRTLPAPDQGDIVAVLERVGDLALGGEPAVEVAVEWREAGFTAADVEAWLGARCFTPSGARALNDAGHTPDDAAQTSDENQGSGHYRDTIGYKIANGDLTPADLDRQD